MYPKVHKTFRNLQTNGRMLKDSNLGELCPPGSSAHKGAKKVHGRTQGNCRQAPAEEKEIQKALAGAGGCRSGCCRWSFAAQKGGNTQTVLASDTQVLSYTDLESSVSATGTVESSDTTKVYSTLAYQVKSVLVEVGDTVQEGDLLAELDAEPIENQIATQQTSMEVASGSAGAQVQSAYDAYENFKQGLDAGLNASLIGAQSQVDTAYDAYVRAQNAYDRYKENVELGENTQVLSVEAQRNSAATALDQAEDAESSAKKPIMH